MSNLRNIAYTKEDTSLTSLNALNVPASSTVYVDLGQNNYDGIQIDGYADKIGKVSFEIDMFGVWYSTFPPSGFVIRGSNIPFYHTAKKGDRPMRLKVINEESSAMTFNARIIYGPHTQGNLPLNMTIGPDSDSAVVRQGSNYFSDVARGFHSNQAKFHKYGRADVTTVLAPVTFNRTYFTPTVNTIVELFCGNSNDDIVGTGARVVTVWGTQLSGGVLIAITEDVDTNGAGSGITALANDYARIYRIRVKESGTYASSAGGSHAGTIQIRETATPANIWASMDATVFPESTSMISVYTTHEMEEVEVGHIIYQIEGTKAVDLLFFKRENANTILAPFSPMLLIENWNQLEGHDTISFSPPEVFTPQTDFGFMAKTSSGTSQIMVSMHGISKTLT